MHCYHVTGRHQLVHFCGSWGWGSNVPTWQVPIWHILKERGEQCSHVAARPLGTFLKEIAGCTVTTWQVDINWRFFCWKGGQYSHVAGWFPGSFLRILMRDTSIPNWQAIFQRILEEIIAGRVHIYQDTQLGAFRREVRAGFHMSSINSCTFFRVLEQRKKISTGKQQMQVMDY